MNIALLVIDVQKAFLKKQEGTENYESIMEHINATSSLFRKTGHPVFIIRDIEDGNDEDHRIVKDLMTGSGDREVLKMYSNSFWKTNLEDQLKEKKIDFLVLCGNAAEYCVLATFNGAIERGFQAVMLQNGVFAQHPQGLMDLFQNRPLISYTAIRYLLSKT
jgi:nicotinamidase-related amidase